MQKILELRVVVDTPAGTNTGELSYFVQQRALAALGMRAIPFHHVHCFIRVMRQEEYIAFTERKIHYKAGETLFDAGMVQMIRVGIGVCGCKCKLKRAVEDWSKVTCLRCLRKSPSPQMKLFEES